jgi:hypothetical protein
MDEGRAGHRHFKRGQPSRSMEPLMERNAATRGPWSRSRPSQRRRNRTTTVMHGRRERFLNHMSQVRILPAALCDVAGHRAQVSRDIVHGRAWGW